MPCKGFSAQDLVDFSVRLRSIRFHRATSTYLVAEDGSADLVARIVRDDPPLSNRSAAAVQRSLNGRTSVCIAGVPAMEARRTVTSTAGGT